MVFNINKAALDAHFSGAGEGDKFKIQYGHGENAGQAIITRATNGEIPLRKFGSKGTCTLTVSTWRGITNAEHKSAPCRIMASNDQGLVVRLPWGAA